MQVRPETPDDAQAIFDLTKVAFAPMSFADDNDPYLTGRLRDAGDLILSLVGLDAGTIIAHAAFSPATVPCPGRWAALGPVSVTPDRQKQGLGSKLVADGLARLKGMGFDGCVLIGNPAVYGPMGFMSGKLTYRDLASSYVMGQSWSGITPEGEITFAPALEG